MKLNRRLLLLLAPLFGSPAGAKSAKKQAHSPTPQTDTGIPLYSTAISYGDMVFVSGHGVNEVQGVQAQTTMVLNKIEAALKSAGTSMQNAVKCNVFLKSVEDYAAMNEVYRGRFGAVPPVRTTVVVADIPLKGCLVEIEVIAGR